MNRRIFASALVVSLLLAASVSADDWPQFRGPTRDSKSAETGLLKTWPAGGPKLLWTATGCGAGYGSPAVTGSMIYLTGDLDGKACVMAFDLDGKPKNQQAFGKENTVNPSKYFGTRSTPTVEGGFVYVAGAFGELACLDAKTLAPKWGFNFCERFKGQRPMWEYAESPLIDGDNLICTPGGPNATIVAVNKKTGETVWTSQGLSDPASYDSCIKMTVDKMPMIVTMTLKSLVGVSARTGQFLWRCPCAANPIENSPSPIFLGNRVFCANFQGSGAADIQVSPDGAKATQAWLAKDLASTTGGYVLVDGYIYGNNPVGPVCLDWKTGETKWKAERKERGGVTYADGMLYLLGESSRRVALAPATPDGFKVAGEFTLPKLPGTGKDPLWAYPAIANGRLYIRLWDSLFCYDIKQ